MMTRSALLLLAACLHTQALGQASNPTPESPGTSDPLKGPSVSTPDAGPSIVDRAFDGSLKRLDTRPEEAGVRKLDLTTEEKHAVEKVLQARASVLDGIVRDHIDLLLKAQSAKASGDSKAIKEATREFNEVMRPIMARGPLVEQLSNVLSPEHALELQRMVRDYYRAVIAESIRKKPTGDPMDEGAAPAPGDGANQPPPSREGADPASKDAAARRQAIARTMLETFGQEVKRSYERIAADGQSRLDELVRQLDVSPEQQARIQAIATEFGQKTKLNPTRAQRLEVFRQIAQELTPEQRKKLIELAASRR